MRNSLLIEEDKHISSRKFIEPGITLFDDILKGGLLLRLKVTGRSMSPFLDGGEVLTILQVPPSSLRVGDLIFFRTRTGNALLHRIVRRLRERDQFLLQTKGDALVAFDEPVPADNVLGMVCAVEKKTPGGIVRHRDLTSGFWRRMNLLIAIIGIGRSMICRILFSR